MGVIDYLVSSYALGRLKSLWGDSREEEADRTSQLRFSKYEMGLLCGP